MTEAECGTCPACEMSFRGAEIPEDSLLQGYYGEWSVGDPPEFFSLCIGVQVPGVYDGICYWMCPFCGARWHRFSNYANDGRIMRAKVEEYWTLCDKEEV